MNRYHLYKTLAEAGFPQGGAGSIIISPDGNDNAYVPRPEELYSQFIADPEGWNALTDALAQAWIQNKTGKPYQEPVVKVIIDTVFVPANVTNKKAPAKKHGTAKKETRRG